MAERSFSAPPGIPSARRELGYGDPRWSGLRARCAPDRSDNTYDAAPGSFPPPYLGRMTLSDDSPELDLKVYHDMRKGTKSWCCVQGWRTGY